MMWLAFAFGVLVGFAVPLLMLGAWIANARKLAAARRTSPTPGRPVVGLRL